MCQNCRCWTMFWKEDQRNLWKMLSRILSKKNISEIHLRENREKTFVTFTRFWPLKGSCSLILSIKNGNDRGTWTRGGEGEGGGWRGFYSKIKICDTWRKSFAENPFVAGCFHLNSKFISKSSSLVWRRKSFMYIIPGGMSWYTDQPG